MSIIDRTAAILQRALGAKLDVIGRQSGAIQRQRKFSGASLFNTIVLTVMKTPNAAIDNFAAMAARFGLIVSATAIEKRFSDALVTFLRSGLEHVMEQAVVHPPAGTPLLEKFPAVYIGDSTTVTVPEEYAEEFPGCGGKADGGKAAVKIQATLEFKTGSLMPLEIQAGRHSDSKSLGPDATAPPGSLKIYDLGYFSVDRFQRWNDAGIYWISRLQPGTKVFDADGASLNVLCHAAKHRRNGPIDVAVSLGANQRVSCRLIILRVPKHLAERRRRKAHERAQKHGVAASAEVLAWCDWTVFVTNCPPEMLTWREVVVLYRARWQIELMFKLWKSHAGLASLPARKKPEERMALFWAKLIGVILQRWLILATTGSDYQRSHWKAVAQIQDSLVSIIDALGDRQRLIDVLKKTAATVGAVARKKTRKKSPALFQLLKNPELLNWTG